MKTIEQNVYKSKTKYIPVYINEKLYKTIYGEYNYEDTYEAIQDMFSITLQDTGKLLEDKAYVDYQYDPLNLSLSGNLGSGRAFFYKGYNIKGDKTLLATSKNELYNNGKYILPSGLKETIIANIISKDFTNSCFETLAVLYTNEMFNYTEIVLDELGNEIKIEKEYPCCLEIRYAKNQELQRISNQEKFSKKEIDNLVNKIAILQSECFMFKFLHGSWSFGNLSIDGNLIDFDTSYFLNEYHPLYSNTNKYKSNYFGYEILGYEILLNTLIDNSYIHNKTEYKKKIKKRLEILIEKNNLKLFCKLLGLTKSKEIEKLYKMFVIMSKYCYTHSIYMNANSEYCNDINIYNFSNFFQNFLLTDQSIQSGLFLLMNNSIQIEDISKYKDIIKELFPEEYNDNNIINNAIEFVTLYKTLLENKKLNKIIYKQYLVNENRKYINDTEYFINLYMSNKITAKQLNLIINNIIDCNFRNYNFDKNEIYKTNLKMTDNYITYINISNKKYNIVLKPLTKILFAKLIIDKKEYMMSHSYDSNGNDILISEDVYYKKLNKQKIKIITNNEIIENCF